MPQKPESYLNPERMSRGITRDDFKKLQLAAEGDGDEEFLQEEEMAFDGQGQDNKNQKNVFSMSKDEMLKLRIS